MRRKVTHLPSSREPRAARHDGTHSRVTPRVRHALTPDHAAAFVKLLHAGLPPDRAVSYILPQASAETAKDIAKAWANDEMTFRATVAFTHGEWADLAPETRLGIARDKFLAEQAYFLYTHEFEMLDGLDLGKAKYAYEAVSAYLQGTGASTDDPLARFLKDLAADKANAELGRAVIGTLSEQGTFIPAPTIES